MDAQHLDDILKGALADLLGLDAARIERLTEQTGLFGHMPELDSMAAANLLGELEERLGIRIDDEEVDAEMMATVGSLRRYLAAKSSL